MRAHLVYHHTSSDQKTSYEANFRAAYDLIRSGKIIHLARENLGDDAALIVAHILSVGQVTIKELHSFWKHSHDGHNNQNGESEDKYREVHGSVVGSAQAQPQIHTGREPGRSDLIHILKQLVQSGFVLRLRLANFRTPADNYFDAQSELRSLGDGTATKNRKSQDELGGSVMEEVASRNDASIALANLEGIAAGSKRSAAQGSESVIRKKIKLTHSASTGLCTTASTSVSEDGSVTVRERQVSSLSKLT